MTKMKFPKMKIPAPPPLQEDNHPGNRQSLGILNNTCERPTCHNLDILTLVARPFMESVASSFASIISSGALSTMMWAIPSGKLLMLPLIVACSLSLPTISAFSLPVHWDITQQLYTEMYYADGMTLSFKQNALDEVNWANKRTDWFYFAVPSYHFDNEELRKGSQKILDNLKSAEEYLKENPPDGEDARDKFGTAVHTLQDFYAHSNWADIKTSSEDIHPDLGVHALSNPPITQAFCDNTTGALLKDVTDITTGYFSFPPLCHFATPEGKCDHGYKSNLSPPFCPARPGINKDDAARSVHDRAYSQVSNISSICCITPSCMFFICGTHS